MSIHALIDDLAIGLRVLFTDKFYRDGVETPPFSDHLEALELKLPPVEAAGDYEVKANTLVGEMCPGFRVHQWKGIEVPTVIHHHGAGEIPFDRGFNGIFSRKKGRIEANLILIRAAFHRSWKEFSQGNHTLASWVALLATSVSLIERLVARVRSKGSGPVLVAGVSMGGQIANLHHLHFNSADVYTPLLSGVAMAEAFEDSAYRKSISSEALERLTELREILNFEERFMEADQGNVFPLLARFDRVVRYEKHKRCYNGRPLVTLNRGHITGSFSYSSLRKHILSHLPIPG